MGTTAMTAGKRVDAATEDRAPRWFEKFQKLDDDGRCVLCRNPLTGCEHCNGARCACPNIEPFPAYVHWSNDRPLQLARGVHHQRRELLPAALDARGHCMSCHRLPHPTVDAAIACAARAEAHGRGDTEEVTG